MARQTPRRLTFTSRRSGGRGPTLVQQSRKIGAGEKALYHDQLGAGRAHIKRPFFDLDESDHAAIVAHVDAAMDAALRT